MRKKRTVLLLVMVLMIASSSMVQASGVDKLTDIKGHWAYEEIKKAYEDRVVAGYNDNTFKPNNKVTTHEFLKMIIVAASGQEVITFTDKPWYEPYVNTFKENQRMPLYGKQLEVMEALGIDNNLANKIVSTSKEISREEAAVVLSKALLMKSMGDEYIKMKLEKSDISFNDLSVSSVKNTEIAVKTGFMIGNGEGTSWRPNDGLTRAEAVTIVNRVKELDALEIIITKQSNEMIAKKEEREQEIKNEVNSNKTAEELAREYNDRVIDTMEVFRLTNIERINNGKTELELSNELNRLAEMKARDMYENKYFDHYSETYGSPSEMVDNYGKLTGMTYSGENIASGPRTAERVVEGWMNSKGHRSNILKDSHTHIGIGYYKGFSVQLFGRMN